MVWGFISAYSMGSLHVFESTMHAKRHIKVLEHICSPPEDVYFREGLVYFSRTVQNHILAALKQHGFVVEESGAELACSPDLSPIENIWHIIKRKNPSKMITNSPAAGNLY